MTENQSLKNNCENSLINLLKLILSLFVVYIHTNTNTGNYMTDMYLIQGLFRIAVPLFFFTAGYYLFSKIPAQKNFDKNTGKPALIYSKRIFKMYIIWSMIYLIYQIYTWTKNSINIRDILIYLEYSIVRGDSYLHLWYLSSLGTGVLLVYFCRKFFSIKTTLLISLAFFVLGLFLMPYYFIVQPIVETNAILNFLYENFNRFIGWPRCGLFFGFFYVSLGAIFADKKIKLNRHVCIIGILISVILSFIELTIIDRNWVWESDTYGALQLSHILLVIFIFSLINSFKNVNFYNNKILRKISTWIYLIHPAVIILIDATRFDINIMSLPFVKGFIVFIISIAISLLIIKLENYKTFSFLKKLH